MKTWDEMTNKELFDRWSWATDYIKTWGYVPPVSSPQYSRSAEAQAVRSTRDARVNQRSALTILKRRGYDTRTLEFPSSDMLELWERAWPRSGFDSATEWLRYCQFWINELRLSAHSD